jgi:L-asparaginase II
MTDILIEEYRDSILENIHRGCICGISERGEVRYAIGDIERLTFLRSSAKPIQVLPAIIRGLQEKFELTDKEQTMMAASHRGEPFHIEALESLSRKIGLSENDLLCLPTYPLDPERRDDLLIHNKKKRRIYHNCSGKHFGIMALCKMLGVSIEQYWHREHPAQREILKAVSILSGVPQHQVRMGVDGCGVPVFALPLKNIAQAYLRLACPDLITDGEFREAVRKLTRLMNENYEMIGGTRQICSTMLTDPNIVAKGGAKGVYCFGLKEERLGFSLKISDGSEEEWPLIVAGILQQISYKNKDTIDKVLELATRKIINDNNHVVGENRIAFHL